VLTNKLITCGLYGGGKCLKHTELLLPCVYEAQNDELCQKVGDHLSGRLDTWNIIHRCSQEVAMQAIDYFLEHYKGKVHINARFTYEQDPEVLGKVLQKRLCPHHKVTITLNMFRVHQLLSFISLLMQCPIAELYIDPILSVERVSIMQLLSQIFASRNVLTVLCIRGATAISSGAFQLADFKSLMLRDLAIKSCGLDTAKVDAIGEMLYHNPSIVSVNLYYNYIADSGVEMLVYHLKRNNKVQRLDLQLNTITAVGASHLTKLISTDCPTLTSIELSLNFLKDEGVHIILSSLTVTMDYIGLHSVDMTSSSYPVIAAALHKVKSITFDLFEDSEVISEAVAATITLTNLTLHACNLNSIYKNVLDAICHNKSIERLEFIRFSSIRLISDVVLHSKILQELIFFPLKAKVSGDILPFADSLMVNNSVKKLRIDYYNNKMNDRAVIEFLTKIKYNSVLEELALGPIDVEIYNRYQFLDEVEDCIKDINEIRRKNKILCVLKVAMHG